MKSKILPPKRSIAPKLSQGRRLPDSVKLNRQFERYASLYMTVAVVILLLTTIMWTVIGARLHYANADQSVNAYLFDGRRVFHEAIFPNAHTQLLKWPLFLLVASKGVTANSLLLGTLAMTLATVCGFALVLYRINRRPAVFGTLCLALAGALALVPTVPYSGALLPVNMAMLTTRNLEYVVYCAALIFMLRHDLKWRSGRLWFGVTLLAILVASDKLFLSLSVGGALIAVAVYAILRRRSGMRWAIRWLMLAIVSGIIGSLLLFAIERSGFTKLAGSLDKGPYQLSLQPKALVVGSAYAVLSVLTNFGANPAFDATILGEIPTRLSARAATISVVGYAVNGVLAVVAVWAVVQLFRRLFRVPKNPDGSGGLTPEVDNPSQLALALGWSSVAAVGAFVVTAHYYPVDARYLTVVLFAAFVALATVLRTTKIGSRHLMSTGIIMTVAIFSSLYMVASSGQSNQLALRTLEDRNSKIASIMGQHQVAALVGDYWRVFGVKLASQRPLNVMPLSSCGVFRDTLNSDAWRVDLDKLPFAYLLTLSGNQTDFRGCSLDQVLAQYGRPNASTLIAGDRDEPSELLLFYDLGANKSAPKQITSQPSTVLPITLEKLPIVNCAGGKTVMTIVAHQDDDLLFINPDTVKSIATNDCLRTVYVTAGDAGSVQSYWQGRQKGAEAAYAKMLGIQDIWIERVVKLSENQYITVANPRANPRISLIYLRLPDGNLHGQGFRGSRSESLSKLESGVVGFVHTVDGQSTYTASELTDSLRRLMKTFRVDEVRTQSNFKGGIYSDHSDHLAVGRFTLEAFNAYAEKLPDSVPVPEIKYYIGYPIHQFEANVFGQELANKQSYFGAYYEFDEAVCAVRNSCQIADVYKLYLERQYQYPY